MSAFELHKKLKEDASFITDLGLSRVLLLNDSTMPWLILVPRRKGVREIYELGEADRLTLMEEVTIASKVIEELYSPDKINVGALGNIVDQLHIHVIGRSVADRAWPGPAWGSRGSIPYTACDLKAESARLKNAFLNVKPV